MNMKTNIGCVLAAAGLMLAVVIGCPADLIMPAPVRTLIAVKADGGDDGASGKTATGTLTLEFDEPVANLTKDDIILNTDDHRYLLAAERLETAPGESKKYILWIKPVYQNNALTTIEPHDVTVSPTGMKSGVILKGSRTVAVYFLPGQAFEERKLKKVTANGGDDGTGVTAETTLLTLEFDEPVANLTKDDIAFSTGDNRRLLAARELTTTNAPNTYLLTVAAVFNNNSVFDVTPADVTVTIDKIDIYNYIKLTGSAAAAVYFQPVTLSKYKVFKLEQVITDGQAAAPITPSSKLTLRLSAEKEELLPSLTADDIIIEPLTADLTIEKGAVSAPIPTAIEGRPARIWELAVSRVNKTGMARIGIVKDGYLQENSPLDREFYGFGVDFRGAEEDAQTNDGQSTSVILDFSVSIPGLAAGNIMVTPYDIAVTDVSPIPNNAGKYRLNLRWGELKNWSHTAQVKIIIDGYVVSPAERQVFLSMRKVDNRAADYEVVLRRVPTGMFKRDGQPGTISKLSKAYWMGETEVTNKLWEVVMGYNPAAGQSDNHPVKNVTWIEAIVFCNKLSILAGKTPVYSLNRSYIARSSPLDLYGEPEKIYTSGVPEWTYKLPATVAADAQWTDHNGQFQQVAAGTAITEAFCRQWFGMSLDAVKLRIEKANKAFLFHSGKWGINLEYDSNLEPDHVNQWGDPWNTSNNGETLVWPDNGAPYPRGTGHNGGGYDYTNDPFGFRTRNAAYDPNIPLVENDNSAYDPNNPPYLRHPVIQNNAGWTAFKTGTGLKSEDSDWPVHPADWLNQWVDAPASPPAGIPAIAYNNDSGAVHHYEVEIVSIDRNADGYRLPTHQQWMWAAMGADMSPGKLSTVDGVSGVNAADYIKPFAGYNGSNDVADYVWYNDSTLQGPPQPVRGKKPNELGIYDLSGNVGEWCYDQWAPLWLLSFPTSGPPVYFVPNPMQDDDHYYGDSHKVLKGGSYTSDVAGLAFGYIAQYIRGIGDTAHDQGLRVMRWVQPGE